MESVKWTESVRARLVGQKVYNGNEIECKKVKMESRSKLGNDRKVKFVRLMKSVRLREKTCRTQDIWKLYLSIP